MHTFFGVKVWCSTLNFVLIVSVLNLNSPVFSHGMIKSESESDVMERKHILQLVYESSEISSSSENLYNGETNKVCQTLILNLMQEESKRSAVDLGYLNRVETPVVVLQRYFESFENSSDTIKYSKEQSYFDAELSKKDLYHPTHFGCFRFIPQCSIALVENLSDKTDSPYFEWILEDILQHKIVKAYRDYFVFFGHVEVINNFLQSSKTAKFLAFKYGLYGEKGDTQDHQYWVGLSTCERRTDKRRKVVSTAITSNSFSANLLNFNIQDHCRGSLNGRTLVANAVAGDQFVRFENYPDGSLKTGAGIYYLMFSDIAKRHNFTIRIYPSAGSGSKKAGKFNGAVGELAAHRADIAFPVSIIESRDGVIDYTNLVAWFEKVFWIGAPRSTINSNAVTKPFHRFIWILLLTSILCFIPIFYLFLKKDFQNSMPKEREKEEPSKGKDYSAQTGMTNLYLIIMILDMIARLLLEQSTSLRGCVGSRVRFAITLWAIFSIVLGCGYRSKLFFFLTFLETEIVPKTHEELAYSNYKLYFRTYGGVSLRYITTSNDPVHKAMVRNNRLKLESTTVACIQRVLEPKTACMDYGFSGDYSIYTNFTLQPEAPDSRSSLIFKRSIDVDGSFPIIWAFPKNSPIRSMFTYFVNWIHASSMYNRWVHDDWNEGKIWGKRWLKSGNSPLRRKIEQLAEELMDGGPKALSLKSLFVAYYMLLICLGTSSVYFVLEYFQNKLHVKSNCTCHLSFRRVKNAWDHISLGICKVKVPVQY